MMLDLYTTSKEKCLGYFPELEGYTIMELVLMRKSMLAMSEAERLAGDEELIRAIDILLRAKAQSINYGYKARDY